MHQDQLCGAPGSHDILRPQAAVCLPAQHHPQAQRGPYRLTSQGAEGRRAGPQTDHRIYDQEPRDSR